MAHTYTQIYIHYVFATQKRMRVMDDDRQTEVHNYIAGIIKSLNCHVQCIGGTEDHIHVLLGLHPTLSVSECAAKIKANSSRFINDKGWAFGKFAWQEGFGAFSVSQSNLAILRSYIKNQQQHHHGQTFMEEYEALLARHNISSEQKYRFVAVVD